MLYRRYLTCGSAGNGAASACLVVRGVVRRFTSGPRTYLSEAPGVLRRVGGDGRVGVRGGLEPLGEVSEPCAGDRACHLVGRHARAGTAEHASDARRDVPMLLCHRNYVALGFAAD